MYQLPTPIWNEIAKSQPLSRRWHDLFRMDFEELTVALGKIGTALERQLIGPTAIRAYLLTAPLLVENEAVSSFIVETGRMELRNSLPELCSVNEAVMLATAEFRLTSSEQAQLSTLLKTALQEASGPAVT